MPWSRGLRLTCLALSTLVGISCTLAGIFILVSRQNSQNEILLPPIWPVDRPLSNLLPGFWALVLDTSLLQRYSKELLRLIITTAYFLCEQSIGSVYSVTQVSALSQTGKEFLFQFDTVIGLARDVPRDRRLGTFHPNGWVCNALMFLLQMIGASSLSLSALTFFTSTCTTEGDTVNCVDDGWESVCISGIPIFLLGSSITLQAVIALWALCRTDILTWNLSPLVIVETFIHRGLVWRIPGRAMCNVLDNSAYPDKEPMPKKPSSVQVSAWRAHPLIRKATIGMWSYIAILVMLGGALYRNAGIKTPLEPGQSPSWKFIPSNNSLSADLIPWRDGSMLSPGEESLISSRSWVTCYFLLLLLQGLGLAAVQHNFRITVQILKDEHVWRKGASGHGVASGSFLDFWPIIILHGSKIFFNWIFGFCIALEGAIVAQISSDLLTSPNLVVMLAIFRPVQTWYLASFLAFFGFFATMMSRRYPKGHQPAAFGHIQTLANLIDEWPAANEPMYWGHKGVYPGDDGNPIYHAGTSSAKLQPVNEYCMYA